jgi:hypothetical protein
MLEFFGFMLLVAVGINVLLTLLVIQRLNTVDSFSERAALALEHVVDRLGDIGDQLAGNKRDGPYGREDTSIG